MAAEGMREVFGNARGCGVSGALVSNRGGGVRFPWSWGIVGLVVMLVLATGVSGAGTDPPDPSEGVVNGKVALMVWPFRDGHPAAAAGFELHLVGREDPGTELTFPADRWIQPPRDVYRFWLEGPSAISPDNDTPLRWAAVEVTPDNQTGFQVAGEVVPAGTVMLGTHWDGARGTFRLLTIPRTVRVPKSFSRPLGLFSKRVAWKRGSGARALLPAGQAVAALFDEEGNSYVGLSEPFAVVQGRSVRVTVDRPPAGRAQLLVHVPYAGLVDATGCRKELAASWAGTPPDVVACGTNRSWLLWLSVKPGAGDLSITTKRAMFVMPKLEAATGRVTSVEANPEERPSLDVSWDLPGELFDAFGEVVLTLGDGVSGGTIREMRPSERLGELVWEGLDPGTFVVELAAGPWRFKKSVVLGIAHRTVVVLRPDVYHISGTVYFGKDPHPATIRFGTGGERFTSVETDDDGRYEVVLFHPGFYMIRVTPRGFPDRGYLLMLDEPIERDRELDLHVPGNRFTVRTVNEAGKPVPSVSLSVFSKTDAGRTKSSPSATDEEGVVVLPPLDPGRVTVTVTDDRFEKSSVGAEVSEDAEERELRLVVRPKDGNGVELAVLLPGGSPAAGARVLMMAPLPAGTVLWQGSTDGFGVCTVPRKFLGEMAVVLHPGTGMTLLPLADPGENGKLTVRLELAAPPLVLGVTLAGGRPLPQQFTRLLLIAGGVHLPSFLLQEMGVLSLAPSGSQWVLSGLPRRPVGLLVWKADPTLDRAAMGGGLDTRAVTVVPGITSSLTLEAVEP